MSFGPSSAPAPEIIRALSAYGVATILFMNGLGLNPRRRDPQVEPLVAAGFRVVRFDWRGHGGSSAPPSGYDIETL